MSLDLTQVAKKYDWTDTKNIKVSFTVKSCRGEADAQMQVYCWLRDYFKNELIYELDEKHNGKFVQMYNDHPIAESKLERIKRKFQKEWDECLDFEVVQE